MTQTAKEKAKEIYLSVSIPDYCFAKSGKDSDWKIKANIKNAIYVVDQILEATKKYVATKEYTVNVVFDKYWEEVKTEIENLNKN